MTLNHESAGSSPAPANETRVERQEPEDDANRFSGSRLLSLVPQLFRFRGPAATTPGLHPENDGSCPSGISDWLLSSRSSRSARHPVTVEIVGSNPIEDAFEDGTVRNPAKRRSSNLRVLWVRLPLVPVNSRSSRATCARGTFVIADQRASAGYRRTQVAVTHPPCAMQVRLLPDAVRKT